MTSLNFEFYNNVAMPHGCCINKEAVDIAMDKICPFPSDHHVMPRYKCGLHCCDNCLSIIIPGQGYKSYKASLSRCTVHGRHTYDKNMFILFHGEKNRNKFKSIHIERAYFYGDIHCRIY